MMIRHIVYALQFNSVPFLCALKTWSPDAAFFSLPTVADQKDEFSSTAPMIVEIDFFLSMQVLVFHKGEIVWGFFFLPVKDECMFNMIRVYQGTV